MNVAERQEIRNPKTGKIERVFVNLESVYPNPNDPNEEMSFEELRAQSRGWTSRDWVAERSLKEVEDAVSQVNERDIYDQVPDLLVDYALVQNVEIHSSVTKLEAHVDQTLDEPSRASRAGRVKKMKVMEVKAEAQTGE
jgi:checkpoint serine/threonine-protein kinase